MPRIRPTSPLLLTILLALLGVAPTHAVAQQRGADAGQADDQAMAYQGEVDLGAARLAFSVRFEPYPDGEGYVGTMDIPAQGVNDAPLQDISITEEDISFTLGPPANAVFEGEFTDEGRASGTMSQAGATFAFRLTPAAEGDPTGPARPQHPEPPYPYEVREVVFQNTAAGIDLAGTLTLPDAEGPFPVALMLTGSGPQDRDETIFGHKPFLVIADHLTRQGVGVLRVDDRGVGGSGGSVTGSTLQDFASDARAGLDFLRSLDSVDPERLGLIGHSEGALVAAMAAAEDDALDFIILLAAPGVPGDELLVLQIERIQRASGAPDEVVEASMRTQREVLDVLIEAETAEQPLEREQLAERIRPMLEESLEGQPLSEQQRSAQVEASAAQLSSPWFRSFVVYDPRTHLRRIDESVLALGGSLDLQVPPDENLRAIDAALRDAPTDDVTVIELHGLNHLFQTAETGLMVEYGQIEETFSPRALRIMADWLKARVLN